MPKQAKKATNLKVTGTKLIQRGNISDAKRVRQERKQVLLTPDASSWVRMMVINWIGNNTNCFLVQMISTDEQSHKITATELPGKTTTVGFSCCRVSHNFCEDPLFLTAQSLSKQFPCFLFTDLFGTKGSSIVFAFHRKIWQQRKNIVVWSGRDKIAC